MALDASLHRGGPPGRHNAPQPDRGSGRILSGDCFSDEGNKQTKTAALWSSGLRFDFWYRFGESGGIRRLRAARVPPVPAPRALRRAL
jgi:hypothetical protein